MHPLPIWAKVAPEPELAKMSRLRNIDKESRTIFFKWPGH